MWAQVVPSAMYKPICNLGSLRTYYSVYDMIYKTANEAAFFLYKAGC
jgi:hypothetical protein